MRRSKEAGTLGQGHCDLKPVTRAMPPRILSFVAPAVWLISFLLTLRHVEPFYSHFYPIAWWCYILLLASRNEMGTRSSLFSFPSLFRAPLQYGAMALFSSMLWFFFELYNAFLQNWGYIGVPMERWLRWPGYFVSFGTVLPGVFETARWLEGRLLAARPDAGAWGCGDAAEPLTSLDAPAGRWGRTAKMEGGQARWNGTLATAAVTVGFLCMTLPLLYPAWFFPVIWIGLVLILDPIAESVGETNLVANLSFGDRRRCLLLLGSGAVCGFFWEFWNYWSGAKWVYTLPYFQFWRIFEMPLFGYLGFLPFALECWLLFVFVRYWWARFQVTGRTVILVVMGAICAAGVYAVDHFVVKSYRLQAGGETTKALCALP